MHRSELNLERMRRDETLDIGSEVLYIPIA